MAGVDDWLSIARSADPDSLREHILTGYKGGKPFTPYVPTLQLPAPFETVLDFGCGVGRSFPYLKTIARRVTGYDLPPMIERCRALAVVPADELAGEWTELTPRRFDLIHAVLVLQHIDLDVCRSYLSDFAAMAPLTYLLTRNQSDFDGNVLEMVARSGLFDSGDCVEVDHDPDTHQLRVLGHPTLDEARQNRSTTHYEVVLRSR